MNPTDIVCTFDQAALIYSYKVRFDNTIFQWSQNKKTGENKLFLTEINPITYDLVYLFPAYTVTELLALLPIYIKIEDVVYNLICVFFDGSCTVAYVIPGSEDIAVSFDMPTISQAMAEAFIWMVKNGHIIQGELKL
jgi:hypothetical protein